MKNFEKYEDELKKYDAEELCSKLIRPIILKKDSCPSTNCTMCCRLLMLWMAEEYKPEPPKVDWSKVEVDTPILVRNDGNKWYTRHFAKYEDGIVYAWKSGRTSLTEDCTIEWASAKLIEDEKEPKIDWSKVEVDTPILVRQGKNGTWLERHFAKYENGDVYAWVDGQTSWTGEDEIKWKYAKLAESEETK